MCRNLAMLYVRGSEDARLLAQACIDTCEKCALEVKPFNSERSRQVYAMCRQAICSCVNIMDMGQSTDNGAANLAVTPAPLFYGVDLRDTLCN